MSSEDNLNDVFIKVSHKRKGKLRNKSNNNADIHNYSISNNFPIDREKTIKRIRDAKEELLTTGIYESLIALLKEGLTSLERPNINKIICFGLGRVSELTISRYQLALLLCLKDLYDVEVQAYDPIFNQDDIFLLKYFKIGIETNNVEGKYHVTDNNTTLFYLPHCPKQLLNNLLWANWGLSLNSCIIISNSINKVIEDNSIKDLSKSGEYIAKLSPYVLELGLVNNFKYFEVFSDTSLHFFPIDQLNIVPIDFWQENSEPVYSNNDVEFIRNQFVYKVVI